MRLTKEIKIRIVLLFAKFESVTAVKRALISEGWKESPADNSIRSVYNRFCQNGSIEDLPRPGRPKFFQETQKTMIKGILAENPKATLNEITAQVDIGKTTIFNFMHLELNVKSYKIQIHQRLFEEDYDRRIETAETLLPYIDDPAMENLIFFSDEATFHTSGYVHTQNCRIWSTEKPTEVYEYQDNTPKVNVWCAMSSNCIIGPYFFDDNVNGANYTKMLDSFFWPAIQKKRIASKIIFQQDGAPAHFSLRAREWLHRHLPGRWIGRRGPLEWAARSPDLTPLDFYLWGYVKQKVYKNYHNDLDELRTSITNVIHSIQPDVLKTVFSNISKRLNLVIQKNGAHIEQFL